MRSTIARTGPAPDRLIDAAQRTLEELRRTIGRHEAALVTQHAMLFEQFRQQLLAIFTAYAITPPPEGATSVIRPQWSLQALRAAGADREVLRRFSALLAGMREVDAEAFRVAIRQAAAEGYQRQLWLLALGGADTAPLLEDAPDEWEATLRDAAYDGKDWESRLGQWSAVADAKFRAAIAGQVVMEEGWESTTQSLSLLATQHTGRVTGLFGNELFRAFTIGATVAGMLAVGRGIAMVEVWLTRQDVLVCPVCEDLHKKVTALRPIDDTHPGCLIGSVGVGHAVVSATSKRFYEGAVVLIQTAAGQQLTVTPNHPVLTVCGWRAAGELKESDEVVYCTGEQRVRFSSNDHNEDMPASIAQVHEAALRAFGMPPVEVEQASEHFHGDGTRGHVAEIRADSVLWTGADTALLQQRRQVPFGGTREFQLPVTGLRHAAAFLERVLPPLAGTMRRADLGFALPCGHTLPLDSLLLTSRSQLNAPSLQVTGHRLSRNTRMMRELQHRFPGQIATTQVVAIQRQAFVGHVFNLQTDAGYYTGNGIVVQNCRCMKVPVPVPYRETDVSFETFRGDRA